MSRRVTIASIGAIAVIAVGLVLYARTLSTAAAIADTLHAARAFADSLEVADRVAPAESISTPDAVAGLYLQRLRLGLGSPFRLIDEVLREDALDAGYRRRIARAMLARTLDGDGYRTEPAALSLIGRARGDDGSAHDAGDEHLALITDLVLRDRDPRVGELTVRLAYRLAAASAAVSRRAPEIATSAASQARDRVLAMRDARALIDAASRSRSDVLTLLRLWRQNRRFAVERPVIAPLPARVERLAVEQLPAALTRIESLAGAESPDGATSTDATARVPGVDGRPGLGLARRMAGVAEMRNTPPQAPVSVIVAGYASLIRRLPSHSGELAARQRFVTRSRNEEQLAAEYSLLRHGGSAEVPAAALTVLSSAVALRPYAQERVWQRGDESPSVRDVQARFGVAVGFGRSIDASWRPYLLNALTQALVDLRRVLPGYDPRGLRIQFGDTPLGDRALALHDPVTRTIFFPATSSAGVMAHEFAHDLDWQAARRAYGHSGGYRTDRAVRQGANQLAGALRQMASAVRLDTVMGRPDAPSRPTEVFARNVDWFVSAALAREGRMNGFLSAVQDPLLIGFASATTPEAAREGGSATLRVLEGMTSIPQPIRTWFTANFGADRRISVHEVARLVLEVPVRPTDLHPAGADPFAAGAALADMQRSAGDAAAAWGCLLDAFADQAIDAGAARAAARYAAEARARGIVREWSAFASRYPDVAPARMRALTGAPWRPGIARDQERQLRDVILWRAFGGRGSGRPAGTLNAADGLRALAGCARRR